MTAGSDASRVNELMQAGIRYVRDNQMNEAYRVFREVVNRDPNNEYAWIWVSQTSPDRREKREAIDRAFAINPNSQHARQALARLEQEEAAAAPVAPTFRPNAIGGEEAPGRSGGAMRFTPPPLEDPNDLRAAMGGEDNGRGKKGRAKKVRTVAANPTRSAPPPRRRSNSLRLILLLLIILVVGGGLVYYLFNRQTTTVSDGLPAETTAAVAVSTTPALEATSAAPGTSALATTGTGVATTVAGGATSPAATVDNGIALVPTPTALSGAASPATTAASSTSAAASASTTAASTTAASSTTVAASASTTAAASNTPAASTTAPASVPGTNAQPATTGDPVNQAQTLISSGNYKGAISLLNDTIKNDPRNVTANFRLGTAYLAAPANQLDSGINRYDEALKSFRRVTELAPTWPGGFARLGETYAAKGDLPAAITAFTRSLELDPNGPERWLALASLYDRNNQPAEAAYARSRAQSLNPTPAGSTPAPAPTPTVTR